MPKVLTGSEARCDFHDVAIVDYLHMNTSDREVFLVVKNSTRDLLEFLECLGVRGGPSWSPSSVCHKADCSPVILGKAKGYTVNTVT